MKKFLKFIKNKFCKGLTCIIIPSNGDAVKSYKISFSILLVLFMVVGLNICLIVNYTSQNKKIRKFESILQQKNLQISNLQKEQEKVGKTLEKSYQITDELNQLKKERLKILESWKTIQRNSKPQQMVSRHKTRFYEANYNLTPNPEEKKEAKLDTLMSTIDQLQKYIKLEEKKQQNLYLEIVKFQKQQEYIPSLNPLHYTRITSQFGMRIHPKLGFSRIHNGIDLGTPIGTKVYATAAGEVSFAGYQNGYGNVVVLEHGYGYQTLYGHNSKLLVKVGEKVKKGQIISLSGNTGTSTGPHLHYEVRLSNQPVNPILFLNYSNGGI